MINVFYYFIIYSFLGYLCEVVYCSIGKRKLVDRGFLYSPICPIYGYGAIFVLVPLYSLREYWYLIIILGLIITSVLEYLTSYIMEKLFSLSWWDYSNYKFNLHGRICLLNSILFTVLVVLMIYFVHPHIESLVSKIKSPYKVIFFVVLLLIYVIDTIASFIALGKLKELINKVKEVKEDIECNYSGEFSKYLITKFVKRFPKLRSIRNKEYLESIKINLARKKKSNKKK